METGKSANFYGRWLCCLVVRFFFGHIAWLFSFIFRMILRVKITLKGGTVLRNWALHKCGEGVSLKDLSASLLNGSSGNTYFQAIEPFYLGIFVYKISHKKKSIIEKKKKKKIAYLIANSLKKTLKKNRIALSFFAKCFWDKPIFLWPYKSTI